MASVVSPSSFEQAAAALASASADGQAVRPTGGGTKLGWGAPAPAPAVELCTAALDQILEHNAGDLTVSLQAGVPLVAAQEAVASVAQLLALDPCPDPAATIGGVIATGDSGPLRHRYGAPRDLLLGMTVALSDGTIARTGGKVIKNVAGYDVAKLFAGSFGTLGVILSVNLRLHPAPAATATALGWSADPDVLATAGRALAGSPLELEALDVGWRQGRGQLLARAGGAQALGRAEQIAVAMAGAGLEHADVATDDRELWERQRAGQRSRSLALVRVGARPTQLAAVLRAAESASGAVVGRVALGTSFVELDPEAVGRFREQLPAGAASVLLDAPAELRSALGVWGAADGNAVALMRRVKDRFDPAGTCNPGVFVAGI